MKTTMKLGAIRACDPCAGQLQCGARWFRHCLDLCGSLHGALTAYASGACIPQTDATRRKINYRMAAIMEPLHGRILHTRQWRNR